MLAAIGLFAASCAAHAAPPDSEAPTVPGELRAEVLSSSEIRLSWQASSDNRRVRRYLIVIGGERMASTGATSYTASALAPATSYVFGVVASDGSNESGEAAVTATTLDREPSDGSGGDTSKPGKGHGRNKPPAEEPPPEEPPPEEPLPEEPPVEESPVEGGQPDGWSLVFDDGFDGNGDLAIGQADSRWRFEPMEDALMRTGNFGLDELGNADVPAWRSPAGKRGSAWYDGYHDDNTYRSDGLLVMQGFDSGEPDPTRGGDTYFDEGTLIDYSSSRLYTTWLDTWARSWDAVQAKWVADPASPNRTFRYGYFETRVSFAEMVTPGFRLSWWLMPAARDVEGQDVMVSNAYDADGDNGVEIDIFEYEYFSDVHPNRIQLALHGGAAGSAATTFDTTSVGIDLRAGFHTIGFLWEADRLVWTIDGMVIKTVTDTALIPDVYSFMILSREMNSGVRSAENATAGDGEAIELLPYRPRDTGLYARNVWAYRDRLASDRGLIDYIRVWQP